MSKPTTEKIRSKKYHCAECGYEKEIQTNHYGQCYSLGNYDCCPQCPPYKRPNTWVCQENPPEHMDLPEPWTIVGLGDVATITRAGGNDKESEVIQ